MVGLFFILFFLLSSCFQGLVRCWWCFVFALAAGGRVCVAVCCRGMMPCGVAVRAMDGRSWLLAVTAFFSFPCRLLFRLLCGC